MTETVIFEIILHAGNARAEAYDALAAARSGDFAAAAAHMARAEEEVGVAHHAQADVIQREAAGEKQEISLLFVHAQDHLMTAIAEKSLISHMIDMEKTIRDLTARLEATK
jgi:PTS system cellobiose-specific IIA component